MELRVLKLSTFSTRCLLVRWFLSLRGQVAVASPRAGAGGLASQEDLVCTQLPTNTDKDTTFRDGSVPLNRVSPCKLPLILVSFSSMGLARPSFYTCPLGDGKEGSH